MIKPESKRVVLVGTGTGVGKTHVACALIRALAGHGMEAIGLKPVETGVPPVEASDGGGTDQERLCRAARVFHVKQSTSGGFHVKRSLYAFPEAVSPHLAARSAGVRIDLGAIRAWTEEHIAPVVVIETAGGLFSPLGPALTNLDLARALSPDAIVLVAPDRLGVLHDVTATLGLSAVRGCRVDATVLCASQPADLSTGRNADELERLDVTRPVATFPRAGEDDPTSLASAEKVISALALA